ncbi:Retinitis pigmentosa 9 protein [Manis javanica]|nr:Retinitis pigmentosa 9 protein [Manis javanica]
MGRRGAQCRPGRGATTRGPPEQELQRRREQKRRRHDAQQLQQLQHLESFYEKPPPGLIKEDETKPEDCIPDAFGCHWGRKSKLCSAHEDPMYDIIQENKRHEKDVRIQQLKQLLEDSTSDEDASSSSSSECKEKLKKKKKEKQKKRKKEKKKKKKRKHKSCKSNESSDSDW